MQFHEIQQLKVSVCKILIESSESSEYDPQVWKQLCAKIGKLREALVMLDSKRPVEIRRTREALIFCCKRAHGFYLILLSTVQCKASHGIILGHLGDLSRYKYLSLAHVPWSKKHEFGTLRERWISTAMCHYEAATQAGYLGGYTRMAFVAVDKNDYLLGMCICLRGMEAYRAQKKSTKRPAHFLQQCAIHASRQSSIYSGLAGAIVRSERAVTAFVDSHPDRLPAYGFQWERVVLLALYLLGAASTEWAHDKQFKHLLNPVVARLRKVEAFRDAEQAVNRILQDEKNWVGLSQLVGAEAV